MKTSEPALHHVEWGRQALDPEHLLSPPIALPASTGVPNLHQAATRSLGLKMLGTGLGRADGSAPPAPAPRGYSQGAPANGWLPGAGPTGRLGQVFRGFKVLSGAGAEGRAAGHRAPAPRQLSRPCLPRERRCVCLSFMLPGGNARAHPPLPAPWLVSSILIPLGLCVGGGCLWHC